MGLNVQVVGSLRKQCGFSGVSSAYARHMATCVIEEPGEWVFESGLIFMVTVFRELRTSLFSRGPVLLMVSLS